MRLLNATVFCLMLATVTALHLDTAMLQRRLDELSVRATLPVVVCPETLLPRQRIHLASQPNWMLRNHSKIGVLSRASPQHGVEATLQNGYLVGGRAFACCEDSNDECAIASVGDVVDARVRWLDFTTNDQLAARSASRVVELTAKELGPLVDRWTWLLQEQASKADAGEDGKKMLVALEKELAALGEFPGVDRPSERALWCAALLNPYGCRYDFGEGQAAAWPAMEIRSTVLSAPSAADRLAVAKTGLVDSIYKLKGGKWPMRSWYWQ